MGHMLVAFSERGGSFPDWMGGCFAKTNEPWMWGSVFASVLDLSIRSCLMQTIAVAGFRWPWHSRVLGREIFPVLFQETLVLESSGNERQQSKSSALEL